MIRLPFSPSRERDAISLIAGARLLNVPEHRDARGALVALEFPTSLPFVPRRVFYMFDCPPDQRRGEHATSCRLALVALSGSVQVLVDSGHETGTCYLRQRDQVLDLEAGIWLRLSEFTAGTILLVAASTDYAQTTYFERPAWPLTSGGRKAS